MIDLGTWFMVSVWGQTTVEYSMVCNTQNCIYNNLCKRHAMLVYVESYEGSPHTLPLHTRSWIWIDIHDLICNDIISIVINPNNVACIIVIAALQIYKLYL